eukprot:scaffold175719_cov13-Tisochrysis_lutea.AAC.1
MQSHAKQHEPKTGTPRKAKKYGLNKGKVDKLACTTVFPACVHHIKEQQSMQQTSTSRTGAGQRHQALVLAAAAAQLHLQCNKVYSSKAAKC